MNRKNPSSPTTAFVPFILFKAADAVTSVVALAPKKLYGVTGSDV
jgi:hypothetical protein